MQVRPHHHKQKCEGTLCPRVQKHGWAMRDSPGGWRRPPPAAALARLAGCAGKRLAPFPQLRTPNGVRIRAIQTKTRGRRDPRVVVLWWAMRDSPGGWRRPPPAAALARLAGCAGKRLAPFPQLRTPNGVRIHAIQTKTRGRRDPRVDVLWWAMRDSNPQPCACKAPALTVAPIARG